MENQEPLSGSEGFSRYVDVGTAIMDFRHMKRKKPATKPGDNEVIIIRTGKGDVLSRPQTEFNRLMKSLETTKARHLKEQQRLDEVLAISIRELMPLLEEISRMNRDIVFHGYNALQTLKLTARRRDVFADMLYDHADDLLADPLGLGDEDLSKLETILEALDSNPEWDGGGMPKPDRDEFEMFRAMLEGMARKTGIDLDLSDLDADMNPEDFSRIVGERFDAAGIHPSPEPSAKPRRKQTKAQAEKERRRLEMEEAKSRDLKSLFKQLAKAFHPDLEPDPHLREHKKLWMQRLNTAYAASDLRGMLQLEMEWLGEEAANLAAAGDEKLKVYCVVLKEQIADLKKQTHHLLDEPQYGPLNRFRDPFYGTLAKPETIKRDLREQLANNREICEALAAGNAGARKMINELVDDLLYQERGLF